MTVESMKKRVAEIIKKSEEDGSPNYYDLYDLVDSIMPGFNDVVFRFALILIDYATDLDFTKLVKQTLDFLDEVDEIAKRNKE